MRRFRKRQLHLSGSRLISPPPRGAARRFICATCRGGRKKRPSCSPARTAKSLKSSFRRQAAGAASRCVPGPETAAAPELPTTDRWRKFTLEFGGGPGDADRRKPAARHRHSGKLHPVRLSVYAAVIDELHLASGGATLKLDWEHDYAARVEPAAGNGGVTAVFHGFDNYAVSVEPARRDCRRFS